VAPILASVTVGDWVKLDHDPVSPGRSVGLINWTGLIMLFNPVRFHGFRIPGL
jgi:hypothetical protein